MTNVLHINNTDERGGAAKIAMDLHLHMLRAGFNSYMAVGQKSSDSPRVIEFSRTPKTAWGRLIYQVSGPAAGWKNAVGRALRGLAEPNRYVRSATRRGMGLDVFDYPWTSDVGRIAPAKPDIIHLHNLHGTYFDLRLLPEISMSFSVVMTLHDMWLLTGHCAYALDCVQWRTGCVGCRCSARNRWFRRIAASHNWRVKKSILQHCRLHIITPSQWLMNQVLQSYVGEAAVGKQVIHNGVDTAIFRPGQQGQARGALGLPQDVWILLFCANHARTNPWKDHASVSKAAAVVAQRAAAKRTVLVVLGDHGGCINDGALEIRHIPYVAHEERVADYYRAADLYLHAAHADTFPTTILESLACGTPVVATAVGGISEQVKSLSLSIPGTLGGYPREDATGVLVRHGDSLAMAEAGLHLLRDVDLRREISQNAACDAAERFTIERQVAEYMDCYNAILARVREVSPRAASLG